jgi:hypothetical protein
MMAFVVGYNLYPKASVFLEKYGRKERPIVIQPPLPRRRRGGDDARANPDISLLNSVDNTPLKLTSALSRNMHIEIKNESFFVVRPTLLWQFTYGTFGMVLAAAMIIVISSLRSSAHGQKNLEFYIWIIFSYLAGLIGVLMFLQSVFVRETIDFDLQHDHLYYGRKWSRKTLPLSEIVAVQALHETHRTRDHCTIELYQVNLIATKYLHDRINIVYTQDKLNAINTARRIACALDVDFIDRTPPV